MIEMRGDATNAHINGSDESYPFENQAVSINRRILEMSADSSLVITNLPYKTNEQSPKDFLMFWNRFTENLKRVLLIRNTGKEVIVAMI